MTKSTRNMQAAPITIIFRGEGGLNRHLEIASREAQAEVKALADRLLEQAKTTFVKMPDLLRDLQVPYEHRDECANIVNDELNEIAKELHGSKAVNYRRKPIPAELYREFRDRVPGSYVGSFLERDILARHTVFDDAGGLCRLAKMVKFIGESFGNSEDEIDQGEAKSLLLSISEEISQAAFIYEEDAAHADIGNEQPQEAAPEPVSA